MDKEIRSKIDYLGDIVNKLIFDDNYNLPLEDALQRAGIIVRYFVNSEYDGFLKWDKNENKPVISVNALHAEVRRRFSMAHELGHLIIDYKWIPYSDKNNKTEISNKELLNVTKYRGGSYNTEKDRNDETIVNEFAASFLVTDSQLKKLISEGYDNYDNLIDEVCAKYNVSRQAASIRVNNFLDVAKV